MLMVLVATATATAVVGVVGGMVVAVVSDTLVIASIVNIHGVLFLVIIVLLILYPVKLLG